MDAEYKNALMECGTDVDAALHRLSGNEDVYETCLALFLEDRSVNTLTHALNNSAWDDAFTAVHALKGVAGNMGFIPLYHAAAEMVILIRSGRTGEVEASCEQLVRYYKEVSDVIRRNSQNTAAE